MTSPQEIRAAIATGAIKGQTSGLAPGYAQANVVILPKADAFDFMLFCRRNERPCPLIDVSDPGDPALAWAAPTGDIRTQVPRYRVYRHGKLAEERESIGDLFGPDLVTFLLGCSFTFEAALLAAGVPVRHIELGRNVPMYVTNRQCRPAGGFAGPMVVSMRPMPAALVDTAARVTAPFRMAHGAPVHAGDPAELGIADLMRVDFGDTPEIRPGEVPVFWACGVTPQMALRAARPALVITHAPGHMFITDLRDQDLAPGAGSEAGMVRG